MARRRTTRCVPVDISTTLVRRVLVDRMLRMFLGLETRQASTLWMVARIWRKAEVTEAHGSMVVGWCWRVSSWRVRGGEQRERSGANNGERTPQLPARHPTMTYLWRLVACNLPTAVLCSASI